MTEVTTTRKAYTCSPDAGCTTHRDTLHFFKEWGIEPALGQDAWGHYMEFSVPGDWPEQKAHEFEAAFSDRSRKLTLEEEASIFAGEIFHASALSVLERFPHDRRQAGQMLMRSLSLVGSFAQQLRPVESAPDAE